MCPYLSPGVYVEEVAGTPPIVGVGTSTAGFIGRGQDALPESNVKAKIEQGEPVLVTNWEQFKSKFGDFKDFKNGDAWISYLPFAIYGFFNNGGTRCWVVRTTDTVTLDVALKNFEAIDEISIIVAPAILDDKLSEHCKKSKDRFAILDGVKDAEITYELIKAPTTKNEYAALYFPWLKVTDPTDITGKTIIPIPPSGHIAGIYSRVDQERGVHKAPANEVVRGIVGLDRSLSKSDQDGINNLGVNAIRYLNGNFRVWGARTLGGDGNGEYKYINVRRLMSFLEESIDTGTQFAVFEPNNKALWQKIKRSVGAFLTTVWRDGALFGDTPEQAFYVKCDESTNPPEIRELGQVVTEIGVAIVKPAEFVIFRISQMTQSS